MKKSDENTLFGLFNNWLREYKYHAWPVDADVLFELKVKAEKITELSKYEKVYSIFSKSGFSNRLREKKK